MSESLQLFRGIAAIFSSDGIISSLSAGAEQWTGYTSRELVGRPVTQILANKSIYEFQQILQTALDWGSWEGEFLITTRNGVQAEADGVITTLSGYGHAGFLLMASSREEAGSADPDQEVLDGIGQKLRSISHEMNNPLAVSMGFLQLLMLNEQCTGRVRIDLERIYSGMGRLVTAVERLHKYAQSLQQVKPDSLTKSRVC
jgi:PAS domain S-box-containing protein